MKSTPTRGVKQTLKPDAYKQSEFGGQKSGIGPSLLGMDLWYLASG